MTELSLEASIGYCGYLCTACPGLKEGCPGLQSRWWRRRLPAEVLLYRQGRAGLLGVWRVPLRQGSLRLWRVARPRRGLRQ